ncbi:unnamed protein product [Acanthoscelides obtectus]|uniref:DDE Tnp4 domain-containing protein n=1 Tax=Acanthoscelides obtectus TaxID=200917 RepID=A0A9P0KAS9_ACAOB|nr:unnamed protein product [Acanthoscelides obtectus]CAK1666486.1 hypothetical protein AOBTE_LOCUS25350 [Acanthoscelides obtectus]
MENKLHIPPSCPLEATGKDTFPYVFVGDEAFGLSENLMRPYAGHNLIEKKRIFNYRLTRARSALFAENFTDFKTRTHRSTDKVVSMNKNGETECCESLRLKLEFRKYTRVIVVGVRCEQEDGTAKQFCDCPDFESRFEDILTMVIPPWIINPYGDIEETNVIIQEELTELSTNEELKVQFKNGYQQFWLQNNIPVTYPEFKKEDE